MQGQVNDPVGPMMEKFILLDLRDGFIDGQGSNKASDASLEMTFVCPERGFCCPLGLLNWDSVWMAVIVPSCIEDVKKRTELRQEDT